MAVAVRASPGHWTSCSVCPVSSTVCNCHVGPYLLGFVDAPWNNARIQIVSWDAEAYTAAAVHQVHRVSPFLAGYSHQYEPQQLC